MKIHSAEFILSAASPRQFPVPSLPEIAFAGRSNVGKSTLINSLLNRKKLVKTSSTPGKTQLINFFKINDEFYFVKIRGSYNKLNLTLRTENSALENEISIPIWTYLGLIFNIILISIFIFVSSKSETYFFLFAYTVLSATTILIFYGFGSI